MQRTWRLIDSDLVPPAVSAALDEAMLESHIAGASPNTLHFYRRSVPTVSVGYFQKVAETLDLDECRKRGVSIVRRMSGGSSIYTDQGQLIYGLVVRESDIPGPRNESFSRVCGAIASAIGSFGLEAVHRPVNDVEVGGKKVSGSAQLRRKGSILQHGTVIVDTDLGAMDALLRPARSGKAPGKRPSERVATLSGLKGQSVDIGSVKDRLAEELARTFDVGFEKGALTPKELETVARLVSERYGKREWNMRS
jgi:lipoate-protein ligase A